MNFKRYLNEKNDSSKQILNFISQNMLPISPKFFEELFGKKEKICFVSHQIKRYNSLLKRQKRKNQISTFTDYNNLESILWGADTLEWKTDDLTTCVSILKGSASLEGNLDLWSEYEKQGRRWIDIRMILNETYIKVFENILWELREFKDYYYEKTSLEFPVNGIKDTLIALPNPEKKEVITLYFDYAYNILKKYKYELQHLQQSDIKNYNEILCYNYEIIKTYILTNDLNNIGKIKIPNSEYIEGDEKYLLKTMNKILKKYQKENK